MAEPGTAEFGKTEDQMASAGGAAIHREPALFVADELAKLNDRLTENLRAVALMINTQSDRITALQSQLEVRDDTVASLLGKILRRMIRG